jgi:hypothetical protein
MRKFNKKIAVFISILTLVVLTGIFIKISIDMLTQTKEPEVGGLGIHFENGTIEPEVKAILENYNMTVNYSIDYNSTTMPENYYIKVDNIKKMDIINELGKNKNLISFFEIKKENYSIIMLSEGFIPDESFLTMLKEKNLQVKKSVFCYVHFGDGSGNFVLGKNCILESDAIRIKNALETNESVLTVSPDYIKG